MLDSKEKKMSRLDVALEKGADDVGLLKQVLEVILTCFVPDQAPLSDHLVERVQRVLQLHEDVGIRRICCDIVFKFGLGAEKIMGMVMRDTQPKMQGAALESMLERPHSILEVGGYNLIDSLMNHVTRMREENLVLVFKLLKAMDLKSLDDKHLVIIRTLVVALLDRIRSEFDSLHDKDVKDGVGDDGGGGMVGGHVGGHVGGQHLGEHLSDWCMPAMDMLVKHHFLISAVSQSRITEEKKRLEENLGRMTLSEQAIMEQKKRGKKELGGGATIAAAGRLTEMLGKLLMHEHCEPEVLASVCKVFVSGMAEGEMGGLPGLVEALLSCREPERGVIILEALEEVRIQDDTYVKQLMKNFLGDDRFKSFSFKPLLEYLAMLRAQEECEWVLPKVWADLVKKGLKAKSTEMAFLMKELRVGNMLTSVGHFKESKKRGGEERSYFAGDMFAPKKVTDLMKLVHLEYKGGNEGKVVENYHQRRRSSLLLKLRLRRTIHVDGSMGSGDDRQGFWYMSIHEAVEEASDGDEIHIYPKEDGAAYKERLIVSKNITIKGMKHSFKER